MVVSWQCGTTKRALIRGMVVGKEYRRGYAQLRRSIESPECNETRDGK